MEFSSAIQIVNNSHGILWINSGMQMPTISIETDAEKAFDVIVEKNGFDFAFD